MKIRTDFTIEILEEDYDKLKELAGEAETLDIAHRFFKHESEDYLIGYLTDHGIRAEVIRRG